MQIMNNRTTAGAALLFIVLTATNIFSCSSLNAKKAECERLQNKLDSTEVQLSEAQAENILQAQQLKDNEAEFRRHDSAAQIIINISTLLKHR